MSRVGINSGLSLHHIKRRNNYPADNFRTISGTEYMSINIQGPIPEL
jgi:hypothetical protein